ncbi:Sensor histidine kinase LiaS [compost metagenome]
MGNLPTTAPLPLKICIYRFVQESLNNAYRHANGEGQSIVARHDNGLLTVQVKDSGPGIQSNAMAIATDGKARLGLAGLRYRVESLGGLFNIGSTPGQGTTVTAQFKLRQTAADT